MIKENRKNTLEMMVRNYHEQVRIVQKYDGAVTISLQEYLTGIIGIRGKELKFALEYGKTKNNYDEKLYKIIKEINHE